jgi:hypothetical protein
MSNGQQRQRHGVTKNLVEGLGGLIVGAAAVLLLRQWLKQDRPKAAAAAAPPAPAPVPPAASGATQSQTQAPKRRPRTKAPREATS